MNNNSNIINNYQINIQQSNFSNSHQPQDLQPLGSSLEKVSPMSHVRKVGSRLLLNNSTNPVAAKNNNPDFHQQGGGADSAENRVRDKNLSNNSVFKQDKNSNNEQ